MSRCIEKVNVLAKIADSGAHISWSRHEALKGVVHATSSAELKLAHVRVLNELNEKNIWVATTEQGVLLSRDWHEPPGVALVCFPDQGTALQVLEDIGVNSGSVSYNAGVMSYVDVIKSSNVNHALSVMVTYDGETPHYVPISHLSADVDKKPWWKLW